MRQHNSKSKAVADLVILCLPSDRNSARWPSGSSPGREELHVAGTHLLLTWPPRVLWVLGSLRPPTRHKMGDGSLRALARYAAVFVSGSYVRVKIQTGNAPKIYRKDFRGIKRSILGASKNLMEACQRHAKRLPCFSKEAVRLYHKFAGANS